MANLVFIRSTTIFDCWDYFDKKTDVLVFGDYDGYKSLRTNVLHAIKSTKNIHLSLLEKFPYSMRCVILPPLKKNGAKPGLRFIERYFPGGTPTMELVVFGNTAGYRHLANQISRLLKKDFGGPSEHFHLDDVIDSVVVPRSGALNLRGPVSKWSSKSLKEYADLVFKKNEDFLPAELHYKLKEADEYQEITPEESEFLKL